MYLNTITENMCTLENKDNPTNLRKKAKRKRKHIPHAQRPSEYVEKRNKRERNRIRAVNEAFEELRKKVPSCGQDPELRISKMEVLTHAIGYIEDLCGCLGYGNFAEYWLHEGQFTRVKENTGSGLQERKTGISGFSCPSLPVYNGVLKERPTNMADPTSLPPLSEQLWRSFPSVRTPSTPDYSHVTKRLCDHYPIGEAINGVHVHDHSFEAVHNSCFTRHPGDGEFQNGNQYDDYVYCEPSYFPCDDMDVGLLDTFHRVSKFYHSNIPFT